MTSRFLKMTGVQLSAQAPKLSLVDPRLDLAGAGALILIEPGHPANPWAGVPANGALVPNLAEGPARALTGLTAAQVSGVVDLGPQVADGSRGIVERSAKGGLHVALSQAHNTETTGGDGAYFAVTFANIMNTWLDTHDLPGGHQFYASTTYRVTRVGTAGTTASDTSHTYDTSSATGRYAYRFGLTATLLRPGAEVGKRDPGSALGPQMAAAGFQGWDSANPASINLTSFYTFLNGNRGVINLQPSGYNRHGSRCFYSYMLVDLTAAGITYAQMAELDYSLFQKRVLTEGGWYYGDTTPTDPTTVTG